MSKSTQKNLALLKALVIGLGVMILIAFALLVYGLVGRMGETVSSEPGGRLAEVEAVPPAPTPAEVRGEASELQGFGSLSLDLPEVCRVEEIQVQGEQRLVIAVEGSRRAGCPIAIILDSRSGRELGRILPGAETAGPEANER